jgi:hypothetical protein
MLLRLNFLALVAVLTGFNFPLQAQETRSNDQGSESTQEQSAPVSDAPFPAFPSNCEPLPVVGGEGNEITKEVSPPSFSASVPGPVSPRIRSNWRTDWFVPTGRTYTSYVVIFMPRANRNFDVSMSLRYPDDGNQRFFRRRRVDFRANEPITVEATPDRVDLAPFQVNTNVGGVQAVGARYTMAVAGCN